MRCGLEPLGMSVLSNFLARYSGSDVDTNEHVSSSSRGTNHIKQSRSRLTRASGRVWGDFDGHASGMLECMHEDWREWNTRWSGLGNTDSHKFRVVR